MEYRADGLPESDLVRTGGYLSGILLATPPLYVVFGAAGTVLAELPADVAIPGSELAPLVFAVGAATVVSGVSLFGYDWIHVNSRVRASLFAAVVVSTTLAVSIVTAFLFLDAIAWGSANGSRPVLGVGVAGLLALSWALLRGGRNVLAGYRGVE
ncbi:hypothetical protein GCM10028857_04320 [Salinarchaeum chitinilyticum]